MRILIQHAETNLYFGKGNKWVQHPREAMAFLDEVRARDYCIYRRLKKVAVVALADEHSQERAAEEASEARLRGNQLDIENENMKPKAVRNSAAPKTKAVPTANRLGSPPAAVRSPVAPPVAAPAAMDKSPKPLSPTKPILVEPRAVQTAPSPAPNRAPQTTSAPAAPAAAPKPVSPDKPRVPQEAITTVEANIDVGFGNSLFIRGQGDALSWDQGTPLQCVGGTHWVYTTKQATGKLVFKLLLNDQVWSQGEDLTVAAGQKAEVVPVF